MVWAYELSGLPCRYITSPAPRPPLAAFETNKDKSDTRLWLRFKLVIAKQADTSAFVKRFQLKSTDLTGPVITISFRRFVAQFMMAGWQALKSNIGNRFREQSRYRSDAPDRCRLVNRLFATTSCRNATFEEKSKFDNRLLEQSTFVSAPHPATFKYVRELFEPFRSVN